MQSLAPFVIPVGLVDAGSLVGGAKDALLAVPGAWGVVAMSGSKPVGLVTRGAAFAADPNLPVSVIMEGPAIVADLDASPYEAAAGLASRSDRSRDILIVCSDGRPVGICALPALLAGLRDRGQSRLDWIAGTIRAPLDSLLTMTELLLRQPLSSDASAQARAIHEVATSLRRILKNAEDMSPGRSGDIELSPAPMKPRSLLDEIGTDWESRSRKAGVTLLLSYDGDPDLTIVADGPRLRQVFDHLIEPALFYTQAGAIEVSVKAVPENGALRLVGRVRDSSPGVSGDRLAELLNHPEDFDDPTLVGMAIARRVVEAMNGRLHAAVNVGAGVTVTFETLCEIAEAEEAHPRPAGGRPSAAHVLVVDDNATNRTVVEALVEMFDCTSESAEDGLQAVEFARTGRFDLILMDIKMPRMSGVEACRAIRALDGPAARTPIVALTANVDPEDARSYLAAGMCGVVEKPIKPEHLLQAVNAALQTHENLRPSAAA